jgi:hypothetical protein
MKAELTIIPKIAIHPSKITCYSELNWFPSKPTHNTLQLPLESYESQADRIINSSRTANGLVSKNATRKIKTALDYLLLMASPQTGFIPKSGKKFTFRIAFVTFDLPSQQVHDDNVIKKILWNSMLIELTKFHNVKNYVWRAEKQKNGNIHFHLIIDKFIKYDELRKRWNRICNKLGYVDRYRENQIKFHNGHFKLRKELLGHWSEENQRKAYIFGIKSNWSSPNSTDIHSIKYVSNLKAYVTKYMTKNEQKKTNEPDSTENYSHQKGRIWSCNQELSNIKGCQLDVDSEISTEIKRLVELTHCHKFEDTYFSIFEITINDIARLSPNILFSYFSSYLIQKFNFNNQLYLS